MANKKKVVLSMQQRLQILEDLKTQSVSTIAAKYCVHPRTIRRININAAVISEFTNKSKEQKKRRVLKKPTYEKLDHRLLTWYAERRALGDVISDAILLDKAIEFKKDIESSSDFKVSMGWVGTFKRRHDIRLREHSKKSMEDQVTEFVSVSTEAEKKTIIKEEEFEEEVCDDSKDEEHDEQQEEILDQRDQDENNMSRLIYLFEALTHISATAPTHIQMLVAVLKQYFFIDRNE